MLNKAFILIYFSFFLLFSPCLYADPSYTLIPADDFTQEDCTDKDMLVENAIAGILCLRNAHTKIAPSHWGHPGYARLSFLYDAAIQALIFKACGYQNEAEEILDYFAARLRIPLSDICKKVDTNGVYGILKLFKSPRSASKVNKALVNALDITSLKHKGQGRLEFWTTPGPTSFLIFALLQVNAEKYKDCAVTLGEVLLAMQDRRGGIVDGDRSPDKVHTEPHIDGYAAFLMLHELTGDKRWERAAGKAYNWFKENVFDPDGGLIDQGLWQGRPHKVFATDVYSWTMAGPAAEEMSLKVIKRLTATMLKKCLVRINLFLPDLSSRTVILCDFSDALDSRIIKVREGFHPMGSIEWTGGVILALQKNAVRFYRAGETREAKFHKALAEILLEQVFNCFYSLEGLEGKFTFYATGQGIEVGPFGSIEGGLEKGWKTPFFYVKNLRGQEPVRGGSIVGSWPILPYLGLNPFILNDSYKLNYDRIHLDKRDLAKARRFINGIVSERTFFEVTPYTAPDAREQLVEPGIFNYYMWKALDSAYAARSRGDSREARKYFREVFKWAGKVVDSQRWQKLARRDNARKKKEFGAIIAYPWGVTYPENDYPLHYFILRYPLLNEMGAAMWAKAVANFELKDYTQAKHWIRRIIREVPLHQIPDVESGGPRGRRIRGYWNALISWEDNPGDHLRDAQIGKLYREILLEEGVSSAKPQTVVVSESELKKSFCPK